MNQKGRVVVLKEMGVWPLMVAGLFSEVKH